MPNAFFSSSHDVIDPNNRLLYHVAIFSTKVPLKSLTIRLISSRIIVNYRIWDWWYAFPFYLSIF